MKLSKRGIDRSKQVDCVRVRGIEASTGYHIVGVAGISGERTKVLDEITPTDVNRLNALAAKKLAEKAVALRLKKTEEKIAEYLKEMDQNDTADSDEDESAKVEALKKKICKLEEEKQRYEQLQDQMKAIDQKEISLVDPDSRLMRVDSQGLKLATTFKHQLMLSSILLFRRKVS